MNAVIYTDLKAVKRTDNSTFKSGIDLIFADGTRILIYDPDRVIKTE